MAVIYAKLSHLKIAIFYRQSFPGLVIRGNFVHRPTVPFKFLRLEQECSYVLEVNAEHQASICQTTVDSNRPKGAKK